MNRKSDIKFSIKLNKGHPLVLINSFENYDYTENEIRAIPTKPEESMWVIDTSVSKSIMI